MSVGIERAELLYMLVLEVQVQKTSQEGNARGWSLRNMARDNNLKHRNQRQEYEH